MCKERSDTTYEKYHIIFWVCMFILVSLLKSSFFPCCPHLGINERQILLLLMQAWGRLRRTCCLPVFKEAINNAVMSQCMAVLIVLVVTRTVSAAKCCDITALFGDFFMNSMKLVILLRSLCWSIHTKDESKRGTAFAFIFGVN